MKNLPKIAVALFGLIFCIGASAQDLIPPFPVDPFYDSWSFYDSTNWLSDDGYAPNTFTNIVNDESAWSSDDGILNCNGLILDSSDAAFLNYNTVESNGHTNLSCTAGTIWFWFSPDWDSQNQGGTGPGDWGRFIDVGAYTTNATFGWWSLLVSPDGNTIYFSGQTNGATTNYLNAPISWTTGSWHLIGLAYTPTNSILYIDDQVATNGIGVIYPPGHDVLTNGFWIGSDYSGTEQARGEFVDLESWLTQFPSNEFSEYYDEMLPELPGSFGGGSHTDSFSPPDLGSGGGGGGSLPDFSNYGTNLWLYIAGVQSNSIGLFLVNTEPDISYEIQSKTDLTLTNWNSEGFVLGSEVTNWTEMDIAQGDRTTNLFMRIRSWIDSDNVGIPDWWQQQYFETNGIDPYAASPAGDGFSIFSKYQSGISPTTFVTPPAPNNFVALLSTNGTNILLSWSPAQGTVTNYTIERGVFDFGTSDYDYSLIATVGAGAISFTDVGGENDGDGSDPAYELTANYAGGNASQTAFSDLYYSPPTPPAPPTPIYNIDVSATLIRNATGRWQLMFSGLPANAQAVHLIWGNGATTNILASSLTNGIYQIPDTISIKHLGDTISVQGMQTNGQSGMIAPAGVLANDAPYFVDGRAHLKQNLIFLLMGAAAYHSYFNGSDYRFNFSTNLEESSFIHRDSQYGDGGGSTWITLDDLWPFNVNYSLRNGVFDTNSPGPFSFSWTTNFDANPAPPVLTNAQPYWISQGADSTRLADLGVSFSTHHYFDDGILTNYASLQSSAFDNCYGLAAESGEGINGSTPVDPATGISSTTYWPCPGFVGYQSVSV